MKLKLGDSLDLSDERYFSKLTQLFNSHQLLQDTLVSEHSSYPLELEIKNVETFLATFKSYGGQTSLVDLSEDRAVP